MGQLIKTLKKLPFLEKDVYIELNEAIYGNERIIHFHYKNIRYEMTEYDYLTILSGILVEKKNLEIMKK